MKLFLPFIILLAVFIVVTSTKDDHLKHSKRRLHRKTQLHHKLGLKPDLHRYRYHHIKRFKDKDLPPSCRIICPIIFPSNYGGNVYPGTIATPTTHRQTTSTRTTTPSDSDEDTSTEESSEESSEEETDLPSTTTNRTPVSPARPNVPNAANRTNIKASRRILRHKIYRLTKFQKRKLSKKLKLANRNGKKSYKFKNINPFLCAIECDEFCDHPNIEPPTYFAPPQDTGSSSSEEDDSDSDSYEEGEDTPIEATIKPFIPSNPVVNGIKPFGPVDFIGFDDFGPDGELALEPELYFEDKSHRKHKGKKGKNKHSRST